MKKVKIKLYQSHFANISSDLMREFNSYAKVVNFTSFIKESFYNQFGFLIKIAEDIETVDKIVASYYYQDKSEWLREIMRNEIRKNKK